MKKDIYTPMEKIMVDWMKAIAAKEQTAAALTLDLQFLEMESEMGLIDGMTKEDYAQ